MDLLKVNESILTTTTSIINESNWTTTSTILVNVSNWTDLSKSINFPVTNGLEWRTTTSVSADCSTLHGNFLNESKLYDSSEDDHVIDMPDDWPWWVSAFGALFTVMAVSILVCNIVFIAACWRDPRLRTLSTLHVISLSGSDILMALGMLLQVMQYTFYTPKSFRARYVCLGMFATFQTSTAVSFINVGLIAVDRYIYIILPYKYARIVSARRSMAAILSAWSFACALGISILFNNNFREVGCNSKTTIDRLYAWVRFGLFVVSALVSGFCHSSIQLTAWKHIRQVHSLQFSSSHGSRLSGMTAASLRLAKTFFLVYVLLLICWLPALITFAVGVAGPLMNVVLLVAELNAGLNIFVYVFSNRQFRRAILNILQCKPVS